METEVGPRALGHRSLVAVPDKLEVRDKMNRIKHRDWYRPCNNFEQEDVGRDLITLLPGTAP